MTSSSVRHECPGEGLDGLWSRVPQILASIKCTFVPYQRAHIDCSAAILQEKPKSTEVFLAGAFNFLFQKNLLGTSFTQSTKLGIRGTIFKFL